jgi:hypothetical protein
MDYLANKVYGLPKPSRKGHNTGSPHRRKEYVHKVTIGNYTYFKVQLARNSGAQSKIKYFKTFQEACSFVDLLKLNPYL